MAKQSSNGDTPQIAHTINCTLPGFEMVTITFDLMATPAQVNNFITRMAAAGSQEGVVTAVEGWPKDEYGPNPWDAQRVPSLWFAWVARKGWGTAMREYLDDPNS